MYLPPETVRRRSLYGPPPSGPHTGLQDHPTLLFSWFCTASALTMILIRTFGRFVRNSRLFSEDKIMLLSVIPLLARMGLVHVVLLWGTNNVDISNLDTIASMEGVTYEEEIMRRTVGSKLVLASRIFYALFIWTAKFTVSEFLKRLTNSYWRRGYQFSLQCIRIFLLLSFIAVFLATLTECRPISHYWQVVPDPGPYCRQSYAQLFVMGVADIITDLLLIIFPLTIIIPSAMPWLKKLKLSLLFSISAVLPVITILRMISVVDHHGMQQRRTVYASGEIIAAAGVANAVILGSFLRDRGVKKAKYRATGPNMTASTRSDSVHQETAAAYLASINGGTVLGPTMSNTSGPRMGHSRGGSMGDSFGRSTPQSRRPTFVRTMEAAAGSDEDLFRNMCYRSETFDSVADRARAMREARDGSVSFGIGPRNERLEDLYDDDEDDEDEIHEVPILRPAPIISRADFERYSMSAPSSSRTPRSGNDHEMSLIAALQSPPPPLHSHRFSSSRGLSPSSGPSSSSPLMHSGRRRSSSTSSSTSTSSESGDEHRHRFRMKSKTMKRKDSVQDGHKSRQLSTVGDGNTSPKPMKTVTFSDPGGLLEHTNSEASTAIEDIVSPSSTPNEGFRSGRFGSQDQGPSSYRHGSMSMSRHGSMNLSGIGNGHGHGNIGHIERYDGISEETRAGGDNDLMDVGGLLT